MRNRKANCIMILFISMFFLNLNLLMASFLLGNGSSIDGVYGNLKPITGWINLSLSNEDESSLLSAFDKSIKIREFLDLNGVEYSCSTLDCEKSYSTAGEEAVSKSFSIASSETKILGFKLTGNINEISDIRFNISSNAGKSCTYPVSVDILNDGLFEWASKKVANNSFCYIQNPYGCYKKTDSSGVTPMTLNSIYCEKFRIPPVRGFRIGANINGTGNAQFKLILRAGIEKECRDVFSNGSGEVSCTIELDEELDKDSDAEVCIIPLDLTGNYGIFFEDNAPCGYVDSDIDSNKHDFEIFIKPLKFEAPGEIGFEQRLIGNSLSLGNEMSEYIKTRYENCTNDCIIPIAIKSGAYQNITLHNFEVKYKIQGLQAIKNKFYELKITPVLLSVGFEKLDLEKAGFLSPYSFGEKELILKLGNKEVLRKNIKIKKIIEIKDIYPHSASALVPSVFFAFVESNLTDLTYKWSFGNNSIEETTTKNSIKHIFPNVGNYDITVKIFSRENELSRKTVSIKITAPKNATGQTIREYRLLIKNISAELDRLPLWFKNEIDGSGKIIDIEEITTNLNNLEAKYREAFIDEEYTSVMEGLLNLKVPLKLKASQEIKNSRYFQAESQLDLDSISAMEGDEETGNDGKSEYYNAINNWIKENLNANFEAKTYTLSYKNGMNDYFSYVKVTLAPKETLDELYLIINGDSRKIKFSEELKTKDIGEKAVGIKLEELQESQEKTIEFFYPGKINIIEPPYFISPGLESLSLGFKQGPCNNNGKCETGETSKNCKNDCKPWKRTLLWLGLLFFIAFIIYIILQEWYKKNYESHLFVNKTQLFNLINFIYNASNQGISKSGIFSKLKDYKWNGEQMEYAWNKFKGYRTGMWEIPVFKWIENKQVKKEIEKRQGGAYRIPAAGSQQKNN